MFGTIETLEPLAPLQHPIDRALAALDEAAVMLLTSGSPSRFAQVRTIAAIASKLQRLRPVAGVADLEPEDPDDVDDLPRPRFGRRVFNDGADLNREILMIAQSYLKAYMETLAKPKPVSDNRLDATIELGDLMRLRVQLTKEDQPVPPEINTRIDQLLARIGEPVHEPASDPVLSPDDVRGHPPDGAGQLDGDRVGGPVANGA